MEYLLGILVYTLLSRFYSLYFIVYTISIIVNATSYRILFYFNVLQTEYNITLVTGTTDFSENCRKIIYFTWIFSYIVFK